MSRYFILRRTFHTWPLSVSVLDQEALAEIKLSSNAAKNKVFSFLNRLKSKFLFTRSLTPRGRFRPRIVFSCRQTLRERRLLNRYNARSLSPITHAEHDQPFISIPNLSFIKRPADRLFDFTPGFHHLRTRASVLVLTIGQGLLA